ncbi:MAG: hypothetical protein LUE12_01180 [Ruminococcus sp.]|nr:hypothetical protein [Ruminococcus sp.]
MDNAERQRRSYDFFLSLPPQLQNQLSQQKRLSKEGKEPPTPFERYSFSRWYD